jgi:hypothetical protein
VDLSDYYNYTWDFGDGSPLGSGKEVTHTFSCTNYPCTFNVIFNVTNKIDKNRCAKVWHRIKILDPSDYNDITSALSTSPVIANDISFIDAATGEALEIASSTANEIKYELHEIGEKGKEIIKRIQIWHHSEPTSIGEFFVHLENVSENIDLTTLVADVDTASRKSILYMPSWPTEIEESKTLYIPSTGKGAVYVCKNAKSLEEVNMENADVIINIGETKDGMSVGTIFYNNKEYYVVSNVTGTGGGEVNTFTITASAGTGGSITPSGSVTVNYGANQTFTITPNTGYHIKDVKVDGTSVGAVSSYIFTNITANHTIEAIFEKEITQTVIVLQIGKSSFTVNSVPKTLDSPPVIKNSRTLLPIRAIIEALGGTVGWDPNERKVTIALRDTTIKLWIGKSITKVNGVDTPIDATNSKVVPEIINSRTMLPLRFVAESLGCSVDWNPDTKTITITYQGGS